MFIDRRQMHPILEKSTTDIPLQILSYPNIYFLSYYHLLSNYTAPSFYLLLSFYLSLTSTLPFTNHSLLNTRTIKPKSIYLRILRGPVMAIIGKPRKPLPSLMVFGNSSTDLQICLIVKPGPAITSVMSLNISFRRGHMALNPYWFC